jgi:hypothetical protein
MLDLDRARDLVRENWPLLKSWPASQYKGRNEVFEIGTFIQKEYFDEYLVWSAEALNEPSKKNYLTRMIAAYHISKWINENAKEISLISLGQNCFPWLVPNRWGFRPAQYSAKPMSVFDYLATHNESSARLIYNEFADLLSDEHLRNAPLPNGSPMLMNKKHRVLFFHEKGAWWAADDWRRVKETYRARVQYFVDGVKSSRRLYIFTICGACDLNILILCFKERLMSSGSKLLILNVQNTPAELSEKSEFIVLKNIPYPADYSFANRSDFESDRGHVFESSVANAILDEVKAMCRREGAFAYIWRKIKDISRPSRG